MLFPSIFWSRGYVSVLLTFLFMPVVFWLLFLFRQQPWLIAEVLYCSALPPDISFPISPVRNQGITSSYGQFCQFTKMLHDVLPVITFAGQSCYFSGSLQSLGVKSPFNCTLFTSWSYQNNFLLNAIEVCKTLFSSLSPHPYCAWPAGEDTSWTVPQTDIAGQTSCESLPNPQMVPSAEIAVAQVELFSIWAINIHTHTQRKDY